MLIRLDLYKDEQDGRDEQDEQEFRILMDRVRESLEGRIKAKVKAEAVLVVLEGRGLTITAAQRKQVLASTDTAEIDAWLRAAGTTPSVKALLAGTASPRPREKRREKARVKA